MTWIIAPLAIGLVIDRRRWWPPAVLALVMALVTQLIYPLLYGELLAAQALPAVLLTARNLLVAALLVWAVVRVARLPRRAPTLARSAAIHP